MTPGPYMFPAIALWVVLAVLATVLPSFHLIWMVAALVMGILALTELSTVRSLPIPTVTRRIPHSLPLGVSGDVTVRLVSDAGHPIRVDVFDHYPTPHVISGLPRCLDVPAHGFSEFQYQLRPVARGEYQFAQVELRVHSPMRLWLRKVIVDVPDLIRVYPNFATVAKYALMATDNRLSQMGIKKRRRRGEGLEFHQLREYRPGDSFRQVDWKATSRHRKLISREYQDSRDQQIVFLIDCGRRMSARDHELSHFDHSLNSVLLLGYVALRQGDAVGLMTFGGPRRFIPPRKGAGVVNTILNGVYDLQPGLESPDYASVAADLHKRLRKRSLVILVTNLRDEDADEFMPALALLRTRHLVLLASLREGALGSVLGASVNNFDDALRLSATQRYLLARRRVHDNISESGALSLDVEPEELPIAMVNRYLDIKRSGRL